MDKLSAEKWVRYLVDSDKTWNLEMKYEASQASVAL